MATIVYTEDQVRDIARMKLHLEETESAKAGVGQLTSFNQLGFRGMKNRPDGWYLPNETYYPALVLEVKGSNIKLGDKEREELLKNIRIVRTRYKNVVGLLYNGFELEVYKNEFLNTVLALLLACATGEAWAIETLTVGSYTFTTGTDDEGEYYTVNSTAALDALATFVNGGGNTTNKRFKQTAGITYNYDNLAEGASNFTAIGNSSHPFNGHFDGGENTISGIRIRQGSSNCQGLFGETGTNAEVEDLTLTECNGRRLLPQ